MNFREMCFRFACETNVRNIVKILKLILFIPSISNTSRNIFLSPFQIFEIQEVYVDFYD